MKIFEFGYEGRTLGGHIVVVEETEDSARKVAQKHISKHGSDPQTLYSVNEPLEIVNGIVIYNWNGDY
jgi:hypothetical protein